MLHKYDPVNVSDPTRKEIPSEDNTDASQLLICSQDDLDQVRQEERRAAFKDAATLIQRKYRFTTFTRVTEVVDLLEAAANQTREDRDDD